MKPVVEYVRYQISRDRAPAFEAAYADAAAALEQSKQCVDYELTRCVDEPGVYVLRITWTSADGHMTGFRQGPMFPAFLAAIRPYVDDITEMRHYEPTPVRGLGGSVPSLYEWAGGDAALDRLTDAFYARVRRDEVVGPLFAHMDAQHPRFVAMWLSEVLGGPARYTEERGGYPHMLQQHVAKSITEEQRRQWVSLLLDAADEVRLPSDPEFRAAFVGYLEWGTRLALHNSQPDVAPAPRAPVPHWGWGVAPPYVGG